MGRTTYLSGLLASVVTACVLLVGCEGTPAGPSISDTTLTSIGLRPTLANDPTACCCHITGVLANNNSVPVNVTIKFAAFQSSTSPDPFASVLYFVDDLRAGARHNVDASGFLVPCTAINLSLLRREITVRGLSYPPY